MTYEQYTSMVGALASGALISFVVVGLVTYFIGGRTDERGKRKRRPWMAALAGVVSFVVILVGGGAVFLAPYPEHQARYERERVHARSTADDAEHQENSRAYNQCNESCEYPPECRNLAPLDGSGQTACNRARSQCRQQCFERYPAP